MREKLIPLLEVVSRPAVAVGGSLALGALIVLYFYVSTAVAPAGTTARVTEGPITEEVDATGSVKAAQSTDLAFQVSGLVAAINVAVGDHVSAGQALVTLDAAVQSAAVSEAEAALEEKQAVLTALQTGTRPEQLANDQSALTQAMAVLADAVQNAYAVADDAIRGKTDVIYSTPPVSAATLSFVVSDENLASRIESERATLSDTLSAWQASLTAGNSASDEATLATQNLTAVENYLNNVSNVLTKAVPSATITTDESDVGAARTEVTASLTALSSAQSTYTGDANTLSLAQAGSTATDIAAGQAAVDAAQAAVSAAQAALGETTLVAPVSGTITAQNANPGQTVIPGTPLVSLIADGKYEAAAQVSDTEHALLAAGQSVSVTSDAFPGVSFPATVSTVDPAATVENGVTSYGVTVTFTDSDPRLSPGLSTTLHIIVAQKPDALQVPTSAVITDTTGSFVYVKGPQGIVKTPVTVGIHSASSTTEILSGLSAGETVLAYGSSAPF